MDKELIDITELSLKLDLINKKTGKPANHILRFWEKEFKDIKPKILRGKRRYYDSDQVEKIKFIKYLLKDKGLTIKGAKMLLNNKKHIDVSDRNNIKNEYLKKNIKKKSNNILSKIKKLKSYG